MKHIVVMSELKAADIRPPALLSRFRQTSISESQSFFADKTKLVNVSCPACDCDDSKNAFEKNGFQYRECVACRSVFVSPRPSTWDLRDYYENSRAGECRDLLTHESADARRLHVLRSRFAWMGRMFDEAGNPSARRYADVGTIHPMVFDEVKRLQLFDELYSVRPEFGFDGDAGLDEELLDQEQLKHLGVVTAFEQLEKQYSPLDFMKSASDMLADGGLLLLTTRTISGFDLQVLWEKAPYIFVPEHLNLMSVEGLTQLLERAGFRVLELSTPGQLDVELVLRAKSEDPTIELPRFVDYLLNHRGIESHADFQSFIQKHRLSSHVRIAAKKGY